MLYKKLAALALLLLNGVVSQNVTEALYFCKASYCEANLIKGWNCPPCQKDALMKDFPNVKTFITDEAPFNN